MLKNLFQAHRSSKRQRRKKKSFLTFLTGGLALAFRQDYRKTEETLDRLIDEVWQASEIANEVKARLGIKEIYKSD